MAVDAHDRWVSATLGTDPAGYGGAADSGPGAAKITDGKPVAANAKMDQSATAFIAKALAAKDFAGAAQQLSGMGEAAMIKLIAKLPKPIVQKLHEVAVADPSLGQNSQVALGTVTMPDAVMGSAQTDRAAKLTKALSPADQQALATLMSGKPAKERDYLEKGLAAGHSVAELAKFDAKIAGKDEKWMQDNLSLTGNSKGKGVKQQWSMSCNATVVEAVRGEMDPLYALKMHEDNPNLTEAKDSNAKALNPKMAEEQRAMLESKYPDGTLGGQARNRNDQTPGIRGRWNTDLLNKSSAETGLAYERNDMGTGKDFEDSMRDINDAAGKKMPVPLIVGDGGAHKTAHYVVVTGTEPGPPRYYSIHDPATGDTVVRSEDQLRTGKLGLNGWDKLAGYEKPTAVAVR